MRVVRGIASAGWDGSATPYGPTGEAACRRAAIRLVREGQEEAALRRLVQAGDRVAAAVLLCAPPVPPARPAGDGPPAQRAGSAAGRWRAGLVFWLAGRLEQVAEAYERVSSLVDESPEAVHVHCLAAVLYQAWGVRDRTRTAVDRALAAAERSGDRVDRASAYRTGALVAAGDGDWAASAAYHRAGSNLAPGPDDGLMLLMLHLSRAIHALDQDDPIEVLSAVEAAVLVARHGQHLGFEPFALSMGAAAKAQLGRLEEALAEAAASERLRHALGASFDVGFQLGVLGQVHRRRREPGPARAALEADLQALAYPSRSSVEALAALARVRAADDLAEARTLAERAVCLGGANAGRVHALLARGWVALLAGDREQAGQDAAEARTVACRLRLNAALAEALELLALATMTPKSATGLLDDAAELRHAVGDVSGEAQVRLVAAKLRGGDRNAVAAAEDQLRRCGVRLDPGVADALTALASGAPPVTVRTLGDFQVCRRGVAVASGEWQSKKARDLLKILIAHRGRPVPRQRLMELLWPDQSPSRTGNRLSVLLTILRRVLDPERRIALPGPIVADRTAVYLDFHVADVDVERFLAAAGAANEAHMDGSAGALQLLRSAADLYQGDFLADDPYEEWAQPLRDESKEAHTSLLRTLAANSGHIDEKVLCLLRIIHGDPYDEESHLGLIRELRAAGRHGEARRRYRAYVERMTELGIDPVPVHRLGTGGLSSQAAG